MNYQIMGVDSEGKQWGVSVSEEELQKWLKGETIHKDSIDLTATEESKTIVSPSGIER